MDSLLLGSLELLGTATNPEYRLGQGLDLGAPQPDQATISSILLDGDVISGDRYRNRTINLSVRVFSNLDARLVTIAQIRSALTLYTDTLAQAVAAKTFTLQWTPDGGLPVIFDCYRGTATRVRTIVGDNQQVTLVTLTFQAKPFGRSPIAQSVAAAASTQVDSFDTAPTGATLNTTTKVEGTGSAQLTTATSSGGPVSVTGTVSRTFAAKNLTGATQLGVWYSTTRTGAFGGLTGTYTFQATVTLISASGSTTYPVASLPGDLSHGPTWRLGSIPLSGGTVASGSGVTLSAVTGYSIGYVFSVLPSAGTTGTATPYLDDLRAMGSAATLIGPTTHAAVLAVPVALGSARTPANLSLAPASGTMTAFVLHSPPVDQDDQAQILSSLASSTDQTVTIAALNSGFRGTFGVFLGASTAGGGATVVITVTQKEGATTVATKALTKTYAAGPHVVPVGEVTLPLVDVPDDNTATSYTVRVQITSGTDRHSELMLLDTRGQTVYTDTDMTAVAAAYVDEPSPLQSGPPVYGSATDRTAAYGILSNCWVTGGPILLEPGTNKLLAWVSTSTPALTATYYPRWLDERVA